GWGGRGGEEGFQGVANGHAALLQDL
ncbi:MAG: hypothetical protein H6P95_2652, partial [Candidatus Aminicenantes bacterium]|nr:hypothetical protein [Candidatus Aminicenantes bacterium]